MKKLLLATILLILIGCGTTYYEKFQQECKRYKVILKKPEDYIKFKKDSAAGKFSWNLENGILTDPDGYVNKKPAEILKDIFQEK